jgi:ABC-type antimicrobial peptide transport system permease subunit
MQRPEVRRAVRVESLVIVAGALLVGLPLGVIAGRSIWRLLSDELGIVTDPAVPWALLALTVPVALAAAIVLAWWPAHRAAALAPAQALRTT